MSQKDCFYSKLAFALSLAFWVPLLNIPFSVISFIVGVLALRLAHKHPNRYGGRGFAVTAIILSSTCLILNLLALMYLPTREIFLSQMLNATK